MMLFEQNPPQIPLLPPHLNNRYRAPAGTAAAAAWMTRCINASGR